jgi:hypothetical protein
MVALGPIDPDQQHRQLPSRLDACTRPEESRGNLMEQCSSIGTPSHQPSASSPGRRGQGLDEGLRLRPVVPCGAHPPAGRSTPLLSQTHCIAISPPSLSHRPSATADARPPRWRMSAVPVSTALSRRSRRVSLATPRASEFRSRLVADACGAPVLRDQGPDRPVGPRSRSAPSTWPSAPGPPTRPSVAGCSPLRAKGYAAYGHKTSRQIPLVLLVPDRPNRSS